MGSDYLKTNNKAKTEKQDPLTSSSCYRNKSEKASHEEKILRLTSYEFRYQQTLQECLPCDNNVDMKEMSCVLPIPKQISVNYFIHGPFI